MKPLVVCLIAIYIQITYKVNPVSSTYVPDPFTGSPFTAAVAFGGNPVTTGDTVAVVGGQKKSSIVCADKVHLLQQGALGWTAFAGG